MQISKISSKNQITLTKDLLDHLAIGAGDRVLIDLVPDSGAFLRPIHRDPIEYIAKNAELYAKRIPKSKRGATDQQIIEATKKIVARELANGWILCWQ